MPDPDHLDRRGAVGVITLDNPPVNALSLSLRVALQDAFEAGLEDPEIEAFVIHSAGRMFSAGADIREFDSGAAGESPTLGELIAMIEASPKPVVAAVHGAAFGGGFELPLGCHARVSVPGTRVGLPEVTLGIVPGAGGTQRLPRLIGVPAALDAIVSGKPMKAEKGYELGLIDEMASSLDDLVDVAVRLAEKLAAEDGPPPKVRDRDDRLAEARENPGLFDDFRASIARRASKRPTRASSASKRQWRNPSTRASRSSARPSRAAATHFSPRLSDMCSSRSARRDACAAWRRPRPRPRFRRPRCSAAAPWGAASPCALPMRASPSG